MGVQRTDTRMTKVVFPHRALRGLLLLVAALGLAGCDEDDYGHSPPDGQGSLIVDNRTASDVRVYVDGQYVGTTGDWNDAAFDLAPGYHRLVLDEKDGHRYYAADMDILEAHLLVAEVRPSNSIYFFDVFLWLD